MPSDNGSVSERRINTDPRENRGDPGMENNTHNSGDSENSPLLGSTVNPLNRRSVRVYRLVLLASGAASLLFVVLLAIDSLISIGLPNTFGSGFEVLCISLVGLANLGTGIEFYLVPSPSNRTFNLIAAALLVFDMVVIATVQQLRHRIGGWATILGLGGAVLTFLMSAFAEAIVKWGQDAEEERLNIVDHHRRIAEWAEISVSTLLRIVFLSAVVLFSINIVIDASDSHIAPLGTLVPIGGTPNSSGDDATYIHVVCTPHGLHGPVVIVEAGETPGEEVSGWVQRADGIKAVCFWDRPGLGLSDNAPSPIGVDGIMSYLEAAIEEALPTFRNESLVLVSHGVGSLYSRVFAAKNMNQVAGLVLVDGLHEELFYSEETALRGLGHWIKGVLAPFGLKKLRGLVTGQGKSDDRVFGLLEPAQARWHKALLQQQISASRRSRLDIELATGALSRDLPLLVVSSADMCNNKRWARYQRLLLQLTDNAVAWKILEGPHELWRNARTSKELSRLLTSFVQYLP